MKGARAEAPADLAATADRRQALALLGGVALWPSVGSVAAPTALLAGALALPSPAGAAVRTDIVTVLYRRESPTAPNRLDDAVRFATLALEAEFIKRGFKVLQPTADVYKLMDQGPAVVVTFAEDAGFSLVFSVYKDLRPVPGQEAAVAEVRLQARVFVGRNILVADEGRGQQFTRTDAATREFGERRAMELAARKAAAELAEKSADSLKALTPADLERLLGGKPSTTTATAEALALPLAPQGGAAPAKPGASGSPPAPHSLPSPVPSPAPAPSAAPALTAALPAPRNRFALVVGMSDYSSVRAKGSNMNDLPGVARDARFAADSLAKLGYAPERMERLFDAKATSGEVRAAMKRFSAKVGPEDMLVIYISGHGGNKDFSASGFGMPILADFRPNDDSMLDFWELQSMVKNLRGRVVWINDTCHSGGAASNVTSVVLSAAGVKASRDVRGPDAASVAKSNGPGQDFAILTASRAEELSWEDQDGGIFTTKLFRELQASRGQLPLGVLFTEKVERDVISKSKDICRKQKSCEQQTPTMAFGGNGNLIRL